LRSYITLLRLPYQAQLGPIFGWGYLLAGGSLHSRSEALYFTAVFLLLHVGAFGGLTALNSYYDRDTGPVGGLWQPPPPPPKLWTFAWCVQLTGLVLLALLDWRLAAGYGMIVLLALGYSHPRTRWKGNPWRSLLVVAIGQGILDFVLGALAVENTRWTSAAWCGLLGATLSVVGFYPLTQLYQVGDDTQRGDRTLAAALLRLWGRRRLCDAAALIVFASAVFNTGAIYFRVPQLEAAGFLLASTLPCGFILQRGRQAGATAREDFQLVHRLMRFTALFFGAYILARLLL
jgi:1,4-dihydroxy-2-naphthoate octaprenyltransferase